MLERCRSEIKYIVIFFLKQPESCEENSTFISLYQTLIVYYVAASDQAPQELFTIIPIAMTHRHPELAENSITIMSNAQV